MRIFTKAILLIVLVFIMTSCASIVSKSSWPLTVNTTPSGARVEIMDRKGVTVFNGTTPAVVSLRSGAGFFAKQSYRIKLSLDGYGEKIISVECQLNGWYIGNIIFGGLIGLLIVDPATGAMYRLEREYISETLDKITTSATVPSLKIMDVNDLSPEMRTHLVSLK
jgi:hypothetical protein